MREGKSVPSFSTPRKVPPKQCEFSIPGGPNHMTDHLLVCDLSVFVCTKSPQLCPTICDPMDCSLPGSSVDRILQARILEWVARPSSRGASRPIRHLSMSPVLLAGSLPLAPPGKPCDLSVGWGLRFWLSTPGGAEKGAREAAQGSQVPPEVFALVYKCRRLSLVSMDPWVAPNRPHPEVPALCSPGSFAAVCSPRVTFP